MGADGSGEFEIVVGMEVVAGNVLEARVRMKFGVVFW